MRRPDEGAGSEGAGSEGSGSEGTGSEGSGSEGAGSEGTGSEGSGSEGAGSEGAGSEGAGSEGTGSEGAGSEGAGSEGVFLPGEPFRSSRSLRRGLRCREGRPFRRWVTRSRAVEAARRCQRLGIQALTPAVLLAALRTRAVPRRFRRWPRRSVARWIRRGSSPSRSKTTSRPLLAPSDGLTTSTVDFSSAARAGTAPLNARQLPRAAAAATHALLGVGGAEARGRVPGRRRHTPPISESSADHPRIGARRGRMSDSDPARESPVRRPAIQ